MDPRRPSTHAAGISHRDPDHAWRRRTRARGTRRWSLALYVYTAATIVAGLAALVWASLVFPIWPTISLTEAGGSEGILLGLVFWILIGLLGGTRVEQLTATASLTFHLPFIIAATAPVARSPAGWVAMISTLEARELQKGEVPWYGTLANHSAMALSAVLAGVVYEVVRSSPLGSLTDEPQAAQLVAIVLATFVTDAVRGPRDRHGHAPRRSQRP